MPKLMQIGLVEYISAAHAATLNGKKYPLHGHTYKVEVMVKGPIKDDVVIDLALLRPLVKKSLEKYAHKNLNDVLKNPTVENLVLALHDDLKSKLKKTGLALTIRIWQGIDEWAQYPE